jgi:hypothetical protein
MVYLLNVMDIMMRSAVVPKISIIAGKIFLLKLMNAKEEFSQSSNLSSFDLDN